MKICRQVSTGFPDSRGTNNFGLAVRELGSLLPAVSVGERAVEARSPETYQSVQLWLSRSQAKTIIYLGGRCLSSCSMALVRLLVVFVRFLRMSFMMTMVITASAASRSQNGSAPRNQRANDWRPLPRE